MHGIFSAICAIALSFFCVAVADASAQDVSGFDAAPAPDRERTEASLRAEIARIADVQKNVLVPMRDGVGLSTDIYLPKSRGDAPAPLIWWKTPYNYNPLRRTHMTFLVKALRKGYGFAFQNERGKYYSQGDWEILGRPREDGVDALNWFQDQEWSSGKVGAIGCSSPAEWQLALADENHPALAAIVPMAPGAGIGKVGPYWEQGNWYRGGAQQMFYPPWLYGSLQPTLRPEIPASASQLDRERLAKGYRLAFDAPEVDWDDAIRHLPLNDMLNEIDAPNGTFDDFTAQEPGDPKWRDGGLFFDDGNIDTPALWLFSWFDVSIAPNLALYNHARENDDDPEAADNQFVAVGPNLHCRFYRDNLGTVGDRTFPEPALDYFGMIFDFFDRYLKDDENGFEANTPKVQYYEMGTDAWRSSAEWPPKGVSEKTFFLSSGDAGANSLFGDGLLATTAPESGGVDRYTYDPMNPTPSLGGGICCIGGALDGGIFDQRPVESRNDVLVYTSAPLEDDLVVVGPIDLTLYISSDAPDTDFMVKLVDVHPDGTAHNVDETAQRARWRSGYESDPVFLEKGVVTSITIQPMVTSTRFKKGHRIRLDVTSSNFPRFARNLNTSEPVAEQTEPKVARNAVHYGPQTQSKLTLRIMPGE
ncbi:MAG: CocE/NonD family hydrolase [Pseudomonadota bacterium]